MSYYKVIFATGTTLKTMSAFYETAGFLQGGKTYFEVRRPYNRSGPGVAKSQ